MTNFIIDGNTVLNEETLNLDIQKLKAIYVHCNDDGDYAFFNHVTMDDNIWTWEYKKGTFKYDFPDKYTVRDFISAVKYKDFLKCDDSFFIRIYENENDINTFVMSNNGRIPYTENFAIRELDKLKSYNLSQIKDEDKEEFIKTFDVISNDIKQIIKLISAQGHNSDSIGFVMRTLESLFRMIPLTEIDDDPVDWLELDDADDESKKIFSVEGSEVKSLSVNKRATNIVRVEYDTHTSYFDNRAVLYNYNGKLYFDPKTSINEVELPWKFTPSKIEDVTNEEDIANMIPLD